MKTFTLLCKDREAESIRIVEAQSFIEGGDLFDLLIGQVEVDRLQILLQPVDIVRLRNNYNVPLRVLQQL